MRNRERSARATTLRSTRVANQSSSAGGVRRLASSSSSAVPTTARRSSNLAVWAGVRLQPGEDVAQSELGECTGGVGRNRCEQHVAQAARDERESTREPHDHLRGIGHAACLGQRADLRVRPAWDAHDDRIVEGEWCAARDNRATTAARGSVHVLGAPWPVHRDRGDDR